MVDIPKDLTAKGTTGTPAASPEARPVAAPQEDAGTVPTSLAAPDQSATVTVPRGGSLPADAVKLLPQGDGSVPPLQKLVDALKPILEKQRLSAADKDQLLATLRKAHDEDLLSEIIDKLQRNGSLKPLYEKLAGPTGAAAILSGLAGGLLAGPAAAETAAQDRRAEFLHLLRAGGVEPRIIASLE